ncbi:unnamed protein product [Chrysoparadoxa australica]
MAALLETQLQSDVPSDIEISKALAPGAPNIAVIAERSGILPEELETYGAYKAKVSLAVFDRLKDQASGSYVVVTGINPTPLGEGKSTTTMGLTQAIGAHLKMPVFANIRQPSQGPTFGVKGGAAGGGYAQVVPMEEFNLHLTGDIHAITAANNLLAAAIDTRMFHEASQSDEALYRRLVPTKKDGSRTFAPVMLKRLEKLGIKATDPNKLTPEEVRKFARLDIDPATITWRRVIDTCDRFLRTITVGKGKAEKGMVRDTGFDITVASEIMAILALATSLADMRERLGRIVVASSKEGQPVTADDLGCGGALTVLMREAIKPTLMQTAEQTPVMVHAGPFANLAHGNSSVVADKIALKLVGSEGIVVTEAGFGADIGFEKFMNIKVRSSGDAPNCAVIVATIRALRMHGGGTVAGAAANGSANGSGAEARAEKMTQLREGCSNLCAHITNTLMYGVKVVVAINLFTGDTEEEIEIVRSLSMAAGASSAVPSNHWAKGGAGSVELAKAVVKACEESRNEGSPYHFLYPSEMPLKAKMDTICLKMYRAASVTWSDIAEERVKSYIASGYESMPICVAKTQYSLSTDPTAKGAPTGHTVHVRDIRACLGAGFIYLLCGEINTIPGLPTRPGFYDVDIDEEGQIIGLF